MLRASIAASVLLAACAGPATQAAASDEPQVAAPPIVVEAPPPLEPIAPPEPEAEPVAVLAPVCSPEATQGGAILCRVPPNTALKLDGKPIARADADGIAVVGHDLPGADAAEDA